MESLFDLIKTKEEAPKEKLNLAELEKFGEYRKYCFDKAKSQWKSPKPFEVHWGQNTSHLKSFSDWHYMKSICDDAERRGEVWSKIFWGSLKEQPWQKK